MTHSSTQPFFLRMLMVAVAVMMVVGVWGQDMRFGRYEQLKRMKGKDLVMLGLEYLNVRNMPDSALLCFTLQANKRFKTEDKDFEEIGACANALKLLGTVYSDWYYDYQKSYGFLYLAEQYSIKHKYFITLPGIHNEMAALDVMKVGFSNQDKGNNEIINKFKTAFHEALRYGDHEGIGYITANLAGRGLSYNLIDSVKEELTTYCSMKKESKYPQKDNQYIYICKAILQFNDKHYDEALSLLDHAMSNVCNDNIHFKANDSINTLCIKAEMLLAMNRNDEALTTYHEILEIAKRTINHVGILDAYKGLLDYYKDVGNDALSAKYELLYLREKDFIVNKSKLADMRQTKFLLEIDQLNEEAKVQVERERMKTYVMWGIALVAIILVVLVVMLIRKYRQEQVKNSMLYQRNLEMLAAHAEEVKRLEQAVAASKERPAPKYDKNPMDEEQRQDLMYRVYLVMEKSEEVYQEGFTLERLAELVESKSTYVSYVINEKSHCNFNALLNEYRIKEACRRMNDREHYGHLTIEGIAASVGIKSRTNFSNNFKKITGLSPSEYQKQQRQKNEKGGAVGTTESGHT